MIDSRKIDHLKTCINEDVEAGNTGLDTVSLKPKALPELDLEQVDTRIALFGRSLEFPLIIESMTGGTAQARKINSDLGKIAQEYGIGMGVGSQRAAIEDPKLAKTYEVRSVAPDILLIGNLGAVQLNKGYGIIQAEEALEMIDADVLALHVNPLQEVIQPEGDTDFHDLASSINDLANDMDKPAIFKGVGEGIDARTAKTLDVAGFDVGGVGGTSWSLVEGYRSSDQVRMISESFAGWGIPTTECIRQLRELGKPLIASGGIRNGIDACKCIGLGADAVGMALPILRSYSRGGKDGVREYLDRFIKEFRIALFLTGSANVKAIKSTID
ncbi:type 2 isopentenyl-diphosphate Delta-isomerase [Candidatus Altiarchaeota archaeon]